MPDTECTTSTAARRYPPGPSSLFPSPVFRPGRNPLSFLSRLVRDYGPIVHMRAGGEHLYLVTEPKHIRDILVTHQRNFRKGRGLERAKALLGDGLLTSEGDLHRRQRRLMQPAFHRERIGAYASMMTDYANRTTARWADGMTVDVADEMMRLTLGVVGKTLFDADVESHASEVGTAMAAVMNSFWIRMLPFAGSLERLPIPALRRARLARQTLDGIIYRMIAERRAAPGDRGDLVSMLLLAQDHEGDGRGMTDDQVRDEAMTIFLAGHETTANALTWTWYLLGEHPDIEARLHADLDRVLADRLPTLADLPSLPFVEQVATESMRLYPPAWIIGRRAINDFELDEYLVPKRSLVLLSPYLTQRDGRHFVDPDRFDPGRWTPAFKESLVPFAYFPFGGGARRCIGEGFAWMELGLVISTIAQRWRLRLVPDHPVVPQAVVTLRLKHGLKMIATKR